MSITGFAKSALIVSLFLAIIIWILTRGPLDHPDPAFDRALAECLGTGLECIPQDLRP